MAETTQLEFLLAAKKDLGVTWDEMARLCEIEPRALKTYRMPESSNDHRSMSKFVRDAVARTVADHKSKK